MCMCEMAHEETAEKPDAKCSTSWHCIVSGTIRASFAVVQNLDVLGLGLFSDNVLLNLGREQSNSQDLIYRSCKICDFWVHTLWCCTCRRAGEGKSVAIRELEGSALVPHPWHAAEIQHSLSMLRPLICTCPPVCAEPRRR